MPGKKLFQHQHLFCTILFLTFPYHSLCFFQKKFAAMVFHYCYYFREKEISEKLYRCFTNRCKFQVTHILKKMLRGFISDQSDATMKLNCKNFKWNFKKMTYQPSNSIICTFTFYHIWKEDNSNRKIHLKRDPVIFHLGTENSVKATLSTWFK